jgi:hypothetical protein
MIFGELYFLRIKNEGILEPKNSTQESFLSGLGLFNNLEEKLDHLDNFARKPS